MRLRAIPSSGKVAKGAVVLDLKSSIDLRQLDFQFVLSQMQTKDATSAQREKQEVAARAAVLGLNGKPIRIEGTVSDVTRPSLEAKQRVAQQRGTAVVSLTGAPITITMPLQTALKLNKGDTIACDGTLVVEEVSRTGTRAEVRATRVVTAQAGSNPPPE